MNVRGLAVIPAAPRLLPAAPDPEVAGPEEAALRAHVAAAVDGLPDVETVVLLSSGPEAMLPDGHRATVVLPDEDDLVHEVGIDVDLLGAVATRTRTPRLRADQLLGAPAVLASLIAGVRPRMAFLPLCVASGAAGDTLGAVAAGLAGALAATDRTVAVVADGYLGRVDRGRTVATDAWLQAAVDAFRDGDADALEQLGPRAAADRDALAWAPLVVLSHLARSSQRTFEDVHVGVSGGVVRLVAR